MIKRIISILMAVLMIIGTSACSDGEKDKIKADAFSMTNVPSYEEIEIGSKTSIVNYGMKMGLNSQNQLLFTEAKEKEAFCIIADENGKKLEEYKSIARGFIFTVDAQDNRYVVGEEYTPGKEGDKTREVTYKLYIYNSKGEEQKAFDLGKRTYTNEQAGITDIAVDSRGTVYILLGRDNIEVMDRDGKKVRDIPAEKIDYIEIDEEDNLLFGSVDGGKSRSSVEKRNANNEKSVWTKELDSGHFMQEMRYSYKDKKLYILTNKGVLSCSSEGIIEGYIFDLKQSSLLDSGIFINDFTIDSNKNIYILAFKSDMTSGSFTSTPLLYKYTPIKDAQKPKNQNTLNISLRYSEQFIEAAISKFQKAHPEINVEVKDYSAAVISTSAAGPDEEEFKRAQKAEEDYQKIISTELMAGSGPDIMEIGGLPYKKFIDKNVLANMSELIKNDTSFDISRYNQNLLDACKYKENLYIMPIYFSFQSFGGSKSIMKKEGINIDSTKWTWEEFLSIAQKISKDTDGDGKQDQYALPKMTAEELFGWIYSNEFTNFVDYDKKTAKFDSPEFINILKFSKDFSAKNVFSPTYTADKLWEMTDTGTIGFNQYYLSTYHGVIYSQCLNNGEVEFLNMPSISGKGNSNYFTPGRTYSINNNSKMKAEAWEFIKFLLSDEIQSSSDMYDFAISNNALKEQAKNQLSQDYVYTAYKDKGRNVKPLTQADVDMVNKMIQELKTIPYADTTAGQIVDEGAKEFFSGKKTAEEAAKLIQDKVNIYLNE